MTSKEKEIMFNHLINDSDLTPLYILFLKEVRKDLEVLEKYKNIEKEFGCPLKVLLEAIKNGIYFINRKNELEFIDEALSFNQKVITNKFIFDNYGYDCLNNEEERKEKNAEIYLEDYGKTWWLKEDKSE